MRAAMEVFWDLRSSRSFLGDRWSGSPGPAIVSLMFGGWGSYLDKISIRESHILRKLKSISH